MKRITVKSVKGFRHECRVVVEFLRYFFCNIIEQYGSIRPINGIGAEQVDFMLGRRNLVMGFFKLDPAFF